VDRVNEQPPAKVLSARKRLGLLAFIALILAIMAYKAYDEGWFLPRPPLVLHGQPAILFFNRHKGCECEMVVYTAAKDQMSRWIQEEHSSIPMISIDLDRRPDLGKQFDIVRAPALLLVDQKGAVVYSQKDSLSDTTPLDLLSLGIAIKEITHE
jgi:hypothetical protein